MKIFSVSDLHMPGGKNKPMDVFGRNWEGHMEKIRKDWKEKVTEDDAVLIAGDISWAMTLDEALGDLRTLADLPGRKVFIRGNHDYWWNGITQLRRAAPDGTYFFLQNDCIRIGRAVICGSRGWLCPGSAEFTAEDEKIYRREAQRFVLCFSQVRKMRGEGDLLIVMQHYPPFNGRGETSLFTELFEANAADIVVFGHVHGQRGRYSLDETRNGIRYLLTACDQLDFQLKFITEI